MRKAILIMVFLSLWVPVAFPQKDKPIITVLDFEVNEVSRAEMKSIISLLSSSLFITDCFTVIDVSQRDMVLKEMEFSMSGCTDESCMLEVGKLLYAEAIVVGSIARVGAKYVLAAKLLETETARTLNTADGIYDNLDDLLNSIPVLTGRLSKPYVSAAAADGTAGQGKSNIPGIAVLSGGLEPGDINPPDVH